MRGSLVITISSNAMQATVCINSNGSAEITEQYVRNMLAEKGVKAGIDEDVVRSLPYRAQYGMDYVIAEGKPAEKGTDGYYEFLFDEAVLEGTLKEPEFVRKGTILGKYHPPVAGAYGFTVLASMVAPVPSAKPTKLRLFNIDNVDNQLVAKVDGQLKYDGERLGVLQQMNIDSEMLAKMKDVICDGDVEIDGDVPSGTSIIAAGSIKINGVVDDAVLRSGHDVIIQYGVRGVKDHTVIEAYSNVEAGYLEYCSVTAGELVRADSFIGCDVNCDGVVVAVGHKGQIRGGDITAGQLVDAMSIGTDQGADTVICLKPVAKEKVQSQTVIVREELHEEGVTFIFGSESMEMHEAGPGEYHLVDREIKRFDIGKFKAKPVAQKDTVVKPKVLLVDDDPVALKQVYGDLAAHYAVVGITKPVDALLYLKRNKPDLIILDYMMPEMSGADLFGKIRKLPDMEDVPVYFLTGVSSKEVVAECLSLYPQGYLLKPISKEEILSVVGGFFKENPIKQMTVQG